MNILYWYISTVCLNIQFWICRQTDINSTPDQAVHLTRWLEWKLLWLLLLHVHQAVYSLCARIILTQLYVARTQWLSTWTFHTVFPYRASSCINTIHLNHHMVINFIHSLHKLTNYLLNKIPWDKVCFEVNDKSLHRSCLHAPRSMYIVHKQNKRNHLNFDKLPILNCCIQILNKFVNNNFEIIADDALLLAFFTCVLFDASLSHSLSLCLSLQFLRIRDVIHWPNYD